MTAPDFPPEVIEKAARALADRDLVYSEKARVLVVETVLAAVADDPRAEGAACCCETSPPEFGGPIPERDCHLHGEPALAEAGLLAEPCPCGGSGLYPNEVPGVGTEWVSCPYCHVAELDAARAEVLEALRERDAARAELTEVKAELGRAHAATNHEHELRLSAERRGAVAALREAADVLEAREAGKEWKHGELWVKAHAHCADLLRVRADRIEGKGRDCQHRYPDGTDCHLSREAHDMPGMGHHRLTEGDDDA